MEQVSLDLPAAGTYELRVRGASVPARPPGLSAWRMSAAPLAWSGCARCAPKLAPGATAILRWRWSGPRRQCPPGVPARGRSPLAATGPGR